jgi:D-alanyl-D-alanine carboxypeptidase (penicillin-binding protein 5/6)
MSSRGAWLWALAFGPVLFAAALRSAYAAPTYEVQAAAALVMDAATGQVLWAKNPDLPLSAASTSKLMTALLALEQRDLRARIVIESRHLRPGSTMGLRPGDDVDLETLLWGLMLPSGNDAAVAIAELVAGTEDAFVARMNVRAAAVGLSGSVFTNPHGLDHREFAPGNIMTARDLAILAREVLRYPLIRQIAAAPERTVVINGRPVLLRNTNRLVRDGFPGVDGLKNGWTRRAGHCYVATATVDGRTLIAVVLNAATHLEAWNLLSLGLELLPPEAAPASIAGALGFALL